MAIKTNKKDTEDRYIIRWLRLWNPFLSQMMTRTHTSPEMSLCSSFQLSSSLLSPASLSFSPATWSLPEMGRHHGVRLSVIRNMFVLEQAMPLYA